MFGYFRIEGELKLGDEILYFTKILNKRDTLPETGLRRNSIYYPFITYINHTIALYFSEAYDDVALFIKRAESELENLKKRDKVKCEYFTICEQYLFVLSKDLLQNKVLSSMGIEVLPDKFKKV
jgi:hypothetical protein